MAAGPLGSGRQANAACSSPRLLSHAPAVPGPVTLRPWSTKPWRSPWGRGPSVSGLLTLRRARRSPGPWLPGRVASCLLWVQAGCSEGPGPGQQLPLCSSPPLLLLFCSILHTGLGPVLRLPASASGGSGVGARFPVAGAGQRPVRLTWSLPPRGCCCCPLLCPLACEFIKKIK